MANTIDLTLTDSDFGVEELPEGNALGCAFCGVVPGLRRLRLLPVLRRLLVVPVVLVIVVLLRRHSRRRAEELPPPAAPYATSIRPEGALTR